MLDKKEYYKDESVMKRLAEYCGASKEAVEGFHLEENIKGLQHSKNLEKLSKSLSCEYLVGSGDSLIHDGRRSFQSIKNTSFGWALDQGLDIFRSVWDKENILGVLDLEYVNSKHKAESYLNAKKCYDKIEPVYNLICNIYDDLGINFMAITTGQGYHFSFRVPTRNLEIMKKLQQIGNIEDSLKGKYRTATKNRRKVSIKHGIEFDGMGKLLESISHEIIKRSSDISPIPITITDAEVGKNESISLDLSMYGDPLYMRDIRVPFSFYQKHKIKGIAHNIPKFASIPRRIPNKKELSLSEVFKIRYDLKKAIKYSSKVDMTIPEADITNLIKNYEQSELHKIHNKFDAILHDDFSTWEQGYLNINTSNFPACIRFPLENPNDHMLKPTNLQAATRFFLKEGWESKHIAGFVRALYETDCGWENQWSENKYDAATRANFYVRIFSDLILTGVDKEIDLNCVSHKEKGFCIESWCGHNLAEYKLHK